jgi:hypothetical protein
MRTALSLFTGRVRSETAHLARRTGIPFDAAADGVGRLSMQNCCWWLPGFSRPSHIKCSHEMPSDFRIGGPLEIACAALMISDIVLFRVASAGTQITRRLAHE